MAELPLDNTAATWGYPVLMGIGLGWSLTYLVAAAQLSAPAHLIAITSGILLSIRSLGASVALGICESTTSTNRRRQLYIRLGIRERYKEDNEFPDPAEAYCDLIKS